MNERQRYLTLGTAIALFCTLLYVPRVMFYEPQRIEWSWLFSSPPLRDKWGDPVGEGYMTSIQTLVIEWGIIVAVYLLVFSLLRSSKGLEPDK